MFNQYDPNKWHSVDGYYELGTNMIEWFSVDDETKLRGRKRDYLFINEATEVTYDEYIQLVLRTSGRIVMDLNPSLWNSWIYDLEGEPDVFYTIVTYKDNPFLEQSLIDEIEKLKDKDKSIWKVFGEGQRGTPTRVVFSHQQYYSELPPSAKLLGYGVDFGFNDPTTRTFVAFQNGQFIDVESQFMRKYKAGRGFLVYEDLNSNLWLFKNGEKVQLSNFSPSFWDVKDDMVVWSENSYLFAYTNDAKVEVANFTPTDYQIKNNILAFRNIMGGVSALVDGKTEEITTVFKAEYEIYGNSVLVKLLNQSNIVFQKGHLYSN